MVNQLVLSTVRGFFRHDCFSMAASISYYTLLSLFPLLLGLLALLGVFLGPAWAQKHLLGFVSDVLPNSSQQLVARNIEGIVESRGPLGFVAVAGLLWSGMAVLSAIRKSLDRAWGVTQERHLLGQKLTELGMLAGIGALLASSVTVTAMWSEVRALLPPGLVLSEGSLLWPLVGHGLPVAVSFLMFALVYRFVPNASVIIGDVLPGAVVATLLFELGKHTFVWYLAHAANYALVYGSLTAVVSLLVWIYLSSSILLLGAEASASYSKLMGSQRTNKNPCEDYPPGMRTSPESNLTYKKS